MKVKLCLTMVVAACLLGACDLIYEDTASPDGDISNYYKPNDGNSSGQANDDGQESLVAEPAPDNQPELRYEDLLGRYYYTDGNFASSGGLVLEPNHFTRDSGGQSVTGEIRDIIIKGNHVVLDIENYHMFTQDLSGKINQYDFYVEEVLGQEMLRWGDSYLMKGPDQRVMKIDQALQDVPFGIFIRVWRERIKDIKDGTSYTGPSGYVNDLAAHIAARYDKMVMYTLYDFTGDGVDEVVFMLSTDKVFEIYRQTPDRGFERIFNDDTLAERSGLTWLANNPFLVHGSGGANTGGYRLYEFQGEDLVEVGSYDYDYGIKPDGGPINQSGVLDQAYLEELKQAPKFPMGSLEWGDVSRPRY
ncbi:hypothetical protein SAMN04487985_11631 [Aerococcus urinaehominis]|uniref:hypothetical protein n=1 Tax=Aerococcus urinaehominis TaxID=128944 RepID=UPI00088A5441|nr:hypothetical protein [Aerococcus urinaehominis]SDM43366.1 hypothetical protein SAMN04487985_11631 [Aerococcus urinaehominis]